MPTAECPEVVVPCFACWVGFLVVEVAAGGGCLAGGESAYPVPRPDVVGECGGWSVGAAAVVEDRSGDRVGEDASPHSVGGDPAGQVGGDRSVTTQLGGLIIQAEQRPGGDDEIDQRFPRPPRRLCDVSVGVRGFVGWCRYAAGDEVDEGVGAALI